MKLRKRKKKGDNMNELVSIKHDEVVCSSLDIAEKFGKRHDRVLRAIEQIKEDSSPQKWGQSFHETTYKDSSGKSNKMYLMNRDGFSILVMGFNGKKALDWKWKYLEAFNQMESMLKERNTQLWVEQRKQGKLTRQAETNVIKQLVEYAKEQGSEHSQMLYITYSKLANKMAGITDRNFATLAQLNELSFIENIILNQIRVGMEREMHYKDIYKDCKKQVELFKDVAYLNAG
uniref:Regulatory protein n=1 Tax=Siphoviridae sp. ctLNL10 TaxID=2825453 RepID=A0A8S5Q4W5_9CAUD|nr:MAG TPA: regulatory protein [Siphoviridae sp. ctLNL10]